MLKVRAQSISKSLKLKKDFSFPPRPVVLRFFFFFFLHLQLKGVFAFRFYIYSYNELKDLEATRFYFSLPFSRTRTRTHNTHSLFTRSVIIELCVELFTIFTEYFSLNIQSILVYITQQFNKRVFKIPCKDELQEVAQPNSTQVAPFSFFSVF